MRTPPEKIEEMIDSIRQDAKAFIKTIADIVIYGNGISYNEAWNMSYEERKIIVDSIEEKVSASSGKKRQQQL